jgi:hypothetical protein
MVKRLHRAGSGRLESGADDANRDRHGEVENCLLDGHRRSRRHSGEIAELAT